MRMYFTILLCVLMLWLRIPVQAQEIKDAGSLDPFFFLAGLTAPVEAPKYFEPPECGSFGRHGHERRAAEMFAAIARTWLKARFPTEAIWYLRYPNEPRLVVASWPLAEALRTFYAPFDARFEILAASAADPSLDTMLWDSRTANAKQRLSFLAGVYARCGQERVFRVTPSPGLRETVLLFLREGCEITDLNVTEPQIVPTQMRFKVKPSERVAQVFDVIDRWQPPSVDWKRAANKREEPAKHGEAE